VVLKSIALMEINVLIYILVNQKDGTRRRVTKILMIMNLKSMNRNAHLNLISLIQVKLTLIKMLMFSKFVVLTKLWID